MPNNDLYSQQLGLAYWYVTHKIMLRQILSAILIVAIIILASYNIYFLVLNLGIWEKDYQSALAGFVSPNNDFAAVRQYNLPQPIQINSLDIYNGSSGFDLVTQIANPNKNWWATFDYQFQIGERLTDKRSGFILPAESKYLLNLSVKEGNQASNTVISNISWKKEINFSRLNQDRFNFDLQNIKYATAPELGLENQLPVSRVSFEVVNQTAYNFANVDFLIFLKAGSQIVAVNQIASGQFLSGERKNLEATFFQRVSRADNVEIIPQVNILDNTILLKI